MCYNENDMIKNKKAKTAKGKKMALVLLFVLVITVATTFFVLNGIRNKREPQDEGGSLNTNEVIDDNKKEKNEEKGDSEPQEEPAPLPESEKGNLNKYDGDDPNKMENLTGFINYAGVIDGVLSVRVTIAQTASGTCNIALKSSSGKTINAISNISPGPSSSFCAQDISSSQLTESGKWEIIVTVKGSDKEGIITGEVEI